MTTHGLSDEEILAGAAAQRAREVSVGVDYLSCGCVYWINGTASAYGGRCLRCHAPDVRVVHSQRVTFEDQLVPVKEPAYPGQMTRAEQRAAKAGLQTVKLNVPVNGPAILYVLFDGTNFIGVADEDGKVIGVR